MNHKILLYYKYVNIDNPEELKDSQLELCKSLGLKGRILIANEGINGTVGGTEEAIDKYIQETKKFEGFEDIDWKISEGIENAFPRMRVVVRDEIVTLGLKKKGEDVDLSQKAEYIEPEDLLQMFEKNPDDFVIVDARNEYEARIGKFKNSLFFDVDNFRDIPDEIKKLEPYKDKLIITYCTGGVRCEKFTAFLKEEGFENVKQLHGGIQRYSDKTGGKNFDGQMYVFDGRVHVDVNKVNPEVISECLHCGVKVARFRNCENAECNERIIVCEDCEVKMEGACSEECIPKAREWKVKKAEKQMRKMQGVSNPQSRE